MLQNPMSSDQVPPQEIERELQATLAARREMGPEYDEHLIGAFLSKLDSYVAQRMRYSRPPAHRGASAGQRLALAIVSVVMLVPLGGISIALPDGLLAFGLACGALALINFVFAVAR